MSSSSLMSTAQVSFAERVIVFIHELFCKVIPSRRHHSSSLEISRRFHLQVDASFEELERLGADGHDYRIAVGGIAYDEVLELCTLMRSACAYAGFGEIAGRYLNPLRFATLIYDMNEEKMSSLNALLSGDCEDVGEIMMRVSAILDNQPSRYDSLDAAAKRKATRDVERIVSTVETIAGGMDALHGKMDAHDAKTMKQFAAVHDEIIETKEELLARADAMLKKLGKVKLDGKRNSKHTPEQKKVCLALWMEAQGNVELKSATTTGKATYSSAFNCYKRQLALVGVTKPSQFISILHTIQSAASAENIKQLEAKIEAERKAKKTAPANTRSKKCGIIHAMKKRAINSMLATALSIFAVAASCMASDGTHNAFRGGGIPFCAKRRSGLLRAA